jgi:UDP-N-acetylmuramoyl-tripeptide--D-alanyl-D-alanine ligase
VIPLRLADLAGLVGGVVDAGHDDVLVTGGATVDSRSVPAGGLFVAVVGERVDGHDFAHTAVEQGAAAALVSRPVDGPHVLVPDVVVALSRLARWLVDQLTEPAEPAELRQSGLLVVGVTGSSGKTSTKDLLAQLLAAAGPTVATRGNLNNEIGLPLTVLEADATTRHLVLEMGARGPGHIADLCRTAPPRIGVELNVGDAHASEFGSRAATAAAKAELVEALPGAGSGGVAVLNADDPLVAAMAARTSARVVTVGLDPTAEVRAAQVRLDGQGRPTYVLRAPGHDPVEVTLPLHGAHHVGNSLAAAAVGLEAGLSAPEVAGVLAAARPASRWRMEVTDRPDGVTVVNDSYNANPESVRAAIEALAAMSAGRRSWAVLGEMLELGAASTARHEEVGRLARGSGVVRVVAVGEGARGVHTGALAAGAADGEESLLVPDVDAAVALLEAQLRPGDVVLVKASRGAGLDRVAAALLADGGAPS